MKWFINFITLLLLYALNIVGFWLTWDLAIAPRCYVQTMPLLNCIAIITCGFLIYNSFKYVTKFYDCNEQDNKTTTAKGN